MGRFFDFGPVAPWGGGLGSIGDALGGIGDAISARKKREMDKAQADAQMALERRKADLYGQQVTSQMASQKRADETAQMKEAQAQARQRGADVTDIGKALGHDQIGLARARANSSQYVNPRTGKLQGIQLDPIDPGPAPVAPIPPTAYAVPDAVQTLTPDQARAQAISKFYGLGRGEAPPAQLDPMAEAQAAEAEGLAARVEPDRAAAAQYETDRGAFDQRTAAYNEAKKNPRFRLTMPGGQTSEFDPREQRAAEAMAANERAAALEDGAAKIAEVDPIEAKAMRLQARLIRSQISNADKAPLTNMQSQLQGQVFTGEQNDKNRKAKADSDAAKLKAKGLGHGGGSSPEGMAALSDYAQKNPGDTAGLYLLAGQLRIPKPDKAVAAVVAQTKSTESQTKDAKQATVGLRAVDAIEKLGYAPTKDETQRWLNNQREVHRSEKMGEDSALGGAAAGILQGTGIYAQNEYDGLSDKAKEYFTNVRRFMETIGRAQSGAAISNAEWANFYGQYGPQSKGGLGAAREYLSDQLKVSGSAGRSLGGAPAPGATGRQSSRGTPAQESDADFLKRLGIVQ